MLRICPVLFLNELCTGYHIVKGLLLILDDSLRMPQLSFLSTASDPRLKVETVEIVEPDHPSAAVMWEANFAESTISVDYGRDWITVGLA